jgi:hypothetical protein
MLERPSRRIKRGTVCFLGTIQTPVSMIRRLVRIAILLWQTVDFLLSEAGIP